MGLQPSLLAIVGPTASGKTALSIEIAKKIDGEILICDAYQIRAGLPILTAKPTKMEQQQAPHHLLGVLPIAQASTAALFVKLADPLISNLHHQKKTMIVCGGTGLYLRALVDGIFEGPSASIEIREQLRREQTEKGNLFLHEWLQRVDQEAAARIMPNDYVRIERALEVYMLTGKPISVWQAEGRSQGPRYAVRYIGIDPGQEILRNRIKARVENMMVQGVYEEVNQVLQQFGQISAPPLGFDLIASAIKGEISQELMKEKLMQQTSQYAKRQRNWFRSLPNVFWYPDVEVALQHSIDFLHLDT